MSQEMLSLLHSLTQLTEEATAPEDHLIQLCDDQPLFHTSLCECLMPYQSEFSDAAYKWLYLWFSSPRSALRRYALQFIPPLLHTYLTALYSREQACTTLKKRCEICLSALIPFVKEFPDTSNVSLHATTSTASLYFYPSTPLDRQTTKKEISEDTPLTPPHSSQRSTLLNLIERINGSTRPVLLPLFLGAFTEDLASHPAPVKLSYCHALTSICASGLLEIPWSPYLKHRLLKQDPILLPLTHFPQKPRIRLSQPLLLEMSRGLRFCLEAGERTACLQAAESVHFRSLLEVFPQSHLCCNALLNLLSEQMREEVTAFEKMNEEKPDRHSISTLEETSGSTIELEKEDHLDTSTV